MIKTLAGAALLTAISAVAAFADGGLTGKVTFHGHVPKPQPIAMNADAKCDAQHAGGFTFSPLVVDAKGGVGDVFVHVKSGLPAGKTYPVPADPKVVLDQKGCWYAPHVFGIMAGQKLQIVNDDPVMHNVNGQPYFNAAMPPGVPPMEKTFAKPQVMFPLKCNIHPWMHAFVGVVDNPYYAVTGKDGSFTIKDLPPGKYTIEAWNEKLGFTAAEVTVPGSANLEFKQP